MPREPRVQSVRELAGYRVIYHAVGVEIVWTNCKLPQDSQCAEYLDPAHLGLRLLPEIAPSLGGSDRTMGLAVGNLASVSLHRVHEEAAAFEVSVHAVLAPTLAHEIGHLLLASQGHSPSGIMRALLVPRGLRARSPRRLQFHARTGSIDS